MALKDLVSLYASGSERRVVHSTAAEPLARAIPDAVPDSGAEGESAAVRVDLAPLGREAAVAAEALDAAGEHDVVVLLLVCLPENVPVGPVVDVVTRRGARIVRVEGIRTRHARTVVVLTRDEQVPTVSYLLGNEIPRDDAAQRRLANEWQLEGAQLRALAATLERRVDGAVAEAAAVRVEKAAVESRMSEQARTHASTVAALERQLSSGEPGLGPRLRRAARTISADPVGGSMKVARAVARRASR